MTNYSALHYSEVSKRAAEGTDAQAQSIGLQHSAKTYAELSAQYANDKINQTHISNCITEIPQDIKLELNNGTLTLKAGSKVYVPNGAGVFDEVVISDDINWKPTGGTAEQLVVMYNNSSGQIVYRYTSESFSGSTAPTSKTNEVWYDTTNNLIKYTNNSGSSWTSGGSLPICLVTANSDKDVTSIDQVFNGFGYIGSTVFALPGVKGLIPNGRNEDGTLKSREIILSSVLTNTLQYMGQVEFYVNESGVYDSSIGYWKYNEEQNLVLHESTKANTLMFATGYETSGVISNFTPKTVFHALNYNDRGIISGFGMPTNRYINLTLGASGTLYTAPANGWVLFCKKANATSQYMYLGGNTVCAVNAVSNNSAQESNIFIPVKKGQAFSVGYNYGGETVYFRFVYAEGEV